MSTAPTAPLQTIELTVPVASAAFFVGCWPSTSLPNGLNQKDTTRMVSARLPRPLPATPIVMAPMIVLGKPLTYSLLRTMMCRRTLSLRRSRCSS